MIMTSTMNSSLLLTPNGKRRGRKPGLNSTVAQRSAANARERSRMRVLSGAFIELKGALPWVPKDTKLSKLDTLKLAAGYIAYLRRILDTSSDFEDKQTPNQHHEQNQHQQSERQQQEFLGAQNPISEPLQLFSLVAQTHEHYVQSYHDSVSSNYRLNSQAHQNSMTMIRTNRTDSGLNSTMDTEFGLVPEDLGRRTSPDRIEPPGQFGHAFTATAATTTTTTPTTNRDSHSISTDSDPSSTYLDFAYTEPTITGNIRSLNRFNSDDGRCETASRLFSPNKDHIPSLDLYVNNERNLMDQEFSHLFSPSIKSIWTGKFQYDETNLLDSDLASDYARKIRVANSLNETVLSLCEVSKQMELDSTSMDPFLVKSCHDSATSPLLRPAVYFP